MAPFSVTVPPGVLPGQALHVQIGGHVVAVSVPAPTDRFTLREEVIVDALRAAV